MLRGRIIVRDGIILDGLIGWDGWRGILYCVKSNVISERTERCTWKTNENRWNPNTRADRRGFSKTFPVKIFRKILSRMCLPENLDDAFPLPATGRLVARTVRVFGHPPIRVRVPQSFSFVPVVNASAIRLMNKRGASVRATALPLHIRVRLINNYACMCVYG